jgi:hypothetical protein
MRHTPETEKFLRAAVKAGLRMQSAAGSSKLEMPSTGVATLQRIKISLRKSKPRKQA